MNLNEMNAIRAARDLIRKKLAESDVKHVSVVISPEWACKFALLKDAELFSPLMPRNENSTIFGRPMRIEHIGDLVQLHSSDGKLSEFSLL